MLTGKLLPDAENEFFELLKIFFPTIYDVKYLMKSCKNLKGGLEEVAKQLEVRTVSFMFIGIESWISSRLNALVHNIKLVVIVLWLDWFFSKWKTYSSKIPLMKENIPDIYMDLDIQHFQPVDLVLKAIRLV